MFKSKLLFLLCFIFSLNLYSQDDCPSTCQNVAPNVGFEINTMTPGIGVFQCEGEDTYGYVCGWVAAWGTPDVAPAEMDGDQHVIMFIQNNNLLANSEAIITAEPVEIVEGNTYQLDYDYSVGSERLDELIVALSDGTPLNPGLPIGSLNFFTIDVNTNTGPNTISSGHCMEGPTLHRGPIFFTAPPDLDRIVVYGTNSTLTGTSWVSLDNLSITLVDGDCDTITKPCSVDVAITNVNCLNHGTQDPTDDTWTFDIFVETFNNTSTCNYWIATGDYNDAGPYNNGKVIFMGEIANYGNTIQFDVADACDPDCRQTVTIDVPEPCSPECDLAVEDLIVSECDDDGMYYVTLTVTGSNDECWMAKQKKVNGQEVLLGTYYDDRTEIFGPFDPSEGNWILWVKKCDNFDCVIDLVVEAPTCPDNGRLRSSTSTKSMIYPNPASNLIQIQNLDKTPMIVQLMSLDGKLMKTTEVDENSQRTLTVGDLPRGVYFIGMYDAKTNQLLKSEKIILTR